MSAIKICQEKLLKQASEKGFLTFDDIMDVADTFSLSLSEVDKLSEAIQLRDVIVYEEEPEIDNSDDSLEDYSRIDYDAIFDELISLSGELEFIVNQVRNLPPPQYGEVQELTVQVANNNSFARERLILIHLRLALKIALSTSKQYCFDVVDAVSSAFIGLSVAVDKYDTSGFSTFQSYASAWIYQNILRECTPVWMEYYFPTHYRDKIYTVLDKYNTYYDGFYENNISDEFVTWASSQTDMTENEVREYLSAGLNQICGNYRLNEFIDISSSKSDDLKRQIDGLNTCEDETSEHELYEYLSTSSIEDNPEENAYAADLKYHINEALQTLTEREEKVIEFRFGLLDGKEYTLEEVGGIFNVTRERVRQIEAKALRKLRHPGRSKKLVDYC